MFDLATQKIFSRRALDVLIQGGLIVVLVSVCYQIFAPFMTLMLWALILAVTLYPLHQMLAGKMGGKQGRSATLLVLLGIIVIFVPVTLLANSLADSVTGLIHSMKDNTLIIPAPSDKVAAWPLIGKKVHALWSMAATDLPMLIQKLQPKIGDLAKASLGFVASIGGGMLQFLFSFIIAGVIMAFGTSGHESARAINRRVFGAERGEQITVLSTATIRAVAQGVIGVAFIQAIMLGLSLMLAGIPFAGVLAVIALVMGIAQLPAVLIVLPALAYIWLGGGYDTLPAILYSVLLGVSGLADNVLKPLMLGRGVDAPMPVILLGALGGMVSGGILGMFVGAALLALGYLIFMGWVETNPDEPVSANALDAKHEA
ncbi:AI-2E family transporter [Chitinibacter sp. S2-10]|uniref:AI-2E family transporter n=1 Tax=Chitinibacter sp. S2-10 TaxID=3373597 RepID=UPI0039779330